MDIKKETLNYRGESPEPAQRIPGPIIVSGIVLALLATPFLIRMLAAMGRFF